MNKENADAYLNESTLTYLKDLVRENLPSRRAVTDYVIEQKSKNITDRYYSCTGEAWIDEDRLIKDIVKDLSDASCNSKNIVKEIIREHELDKYKTPEELKEYIVDETEIYETYEDEYDMYEMSRVDFC